MPQKCLLRREAGPLGLAFLLNLEAGRRCKVRGINLAFDQERVGDRGKPEAENPLEPLEVVAVIDPVNAIEGGELLELRAVDLLEDLIGFGESPRGFGQPERKQPLRLED